MNGSEILVESFMSHVWVTLPEAASTNVVMVLKYNSHIDIGAM